MASLVGGEEGGGFGEGGGNSEVKCGQAELSTCSGVAGRRGEGRACRAEAPSCPGLAAAPTTPPSGGLKRPTGHQLRSCAHAHCCPSQSPTVKWGGMRGVSNSTEEAGRTDSILSLPRQVLLYRASARFPRGPDSRAPSHLWLLLPLPLCAGKEGP